MLMAERIRKAQMTAMMIKIDLAPTILKEQMRVNRKVMNLVSGKKLEILLAY